MVGGGIRDAEHAAAALAIAAQLVECLDDGAADSGLNGMETAWAVSAFVAAITGLLTVRSGCVPADRIVSAVTMINSITEIARFMAVGALLKADANEP